MIASIIQLFLVFILSCLTLFYFFSRSNYGYWKKRGVPYDQPKLFFGSLSFLMRTSAWDVFYDLSKKYKCDYFGIFLSWKPALVINSKELAKKVLVKENDSYQDRYISSGAEDDPLGALNLFTIKSPQWMQIRHEITPTLTSMRLKAITEIMNSNATEVVNRIQKDHVDSNKPVDLKNLFSMYTSDTIAYNVFGIRVSSLKELTSPVLAITRYMIRWNFWRGLEFTLFFLLPAVAKFFRMKLLSHTANEYIKKLYHEVVAEREKTGQTGDKDLVSHLLKSNANSKLPAESGSQYAEKLMMAQAGFFILGAMETSSTTMSYILYELAHHPDEQEKLYEELSAALNESGKDVLDYDDLLKVKYLTACIHETLRLHPPVPHLDRMCNKKCQLTDELTIEAGTPVFVNVVSIHYNGDYYPDPEQWRPERFNDSTDTDNHDFTFIPFGDGPRFCIGKRYAMMQIRAVIAQIIKKYRIKPDGPHTWQTDPYSVFLRPKHGGRVKFIPRS
uniref:unspecific monooxygenase n=2 Tax=Heliothis virescens TaxID=7102 RepID=A0A2Z6JVD9_HELVI|nr:TPA_inf: cytochrome P450 CYP332A2 [Heliothis virescens]